MPDPSAAWFAGPYGRQLRRQVLDFLRSDPHGVIDTAQRILSTTDDKAVAHLTAHVGQHPTDAERSQHIGQVARMAYLVCVVMLLHESQDGAESDDWPDWLREIGREWMGRSDRDGFERHRN